MMPLAHVVWVKTKHKPPNLTDRSPTVKMAQAFQVVSDIGQGEGARCDGLGPPQFSADQRVIDETHS